MATLKAIYYGVNGKPVKVWDKQNGVYNEPLFCKIINFISTTKEISKDLEVLKERIMSYGI